LNFTHTIVKMGLTVSKCEVDPTIVPPPAPPGPGNIAPGFPPPQPVVNSKYENNPGNLEDIHKKCKELFPQPFEGAKLVINKGLNQNFQVSHSLTMSSITPSGYRFGATYLGVSDSNPSEPGTLMMADMDPSGNVNAQGMHQLTDAFKIKFASQIMNNKFAGLQGNMEWRGKDYTTSCTIVNPNLFNESGIAVFHYLQAITKRICVGTELMYQKSPQIENGAATLISCSGRYTGDESVWSGFLGTNGLGLCYYRRLNEDLQVGIDIENNVQQQQLIASVGYQYDIPKASFVLKGMVDTNWTVTGVFEKRLLPMPFTFSMCGSLNHVKNQFRMGCGFSIGG